MVLSQRLAKTVIMTLVAAVVYLTIAPRTATAGGTFEQIRKEVRDDEDKTERQKKEDRPWYEEDESDCDDDESLIGELFGPVVFVMIGAPFILPHVLLDDDLTDDAAFPDFPYDDVPGHLVIFPEIQNDYRWWSGRLTGQYGDDFDGISHVGGRLQLDTAFRVGLDSEWNYRREELGFAPDDRLWTGDANLVFRFAQSETVEFRAGLGANWLHDDSETNYGFNFTYGADIFPVEPWIISSTIDWGKVGSAELFHFRGTVGWIYEGAEIFTGFDHFRIGGAKINGLIAGVRVWF